jgi:hypothetical protein
VESGKEASPENGGNFAILIGAIHSRYIIDFNLVGSLLLQKN